MPPCLFETKKKRITTKVLSNQIRCRLQLFQGKQSLSELSVCIMSAHKSSQVTNFRTTDKWYVSKGRQRMKQKQKTPRLAWDYDLTNLPRTGSRSERIATLHSFQSTLALKSRSLIRVSLGWFDYSKKGEEGRSNSSFLASKRSKTFARRLLKYIVCE
jgi:hypothetical protein